MAAPISCWCCCRKHCCIIPPQLPYLRLAGFPFWAACGCARYCTSPDQSFIKSEERPVDGQAGHLVQAVKKPRLWKISSELKFAAANKCDKANRTWRTGHVMRMLYQLDFYKSPGLLGVLIWTMALSHSNPLASVSSQNKVGFWPSHTGHLWTAPHETSSNGSMSRDGLNPRLLKRYSTVNHTLMEQMASSEIKQPFSSSKKQMNWGRGGGH